MRRITITNHYKTPFIISLNDSCPTIKNGTITISNGKGPIMVNSSQALTTKFISATVANYAGEMRMQVYTYNNFVYGIITTGTGANAPDGTYDLKVTMLP